MDEKKNVKFLTSLTISVNDMDDEMKHLQFVIAQEIDTKQIRCFFDVVDPSKIKLAEQNEQVSNSDSAE